MYLHRQAGRSYNLEMRTCKINFTALLFFVCVSLFSSANPSAIEKGKPSSMVKKLFSDYRYLRFSSAAGYTTGSMAKLINKMKIYLLEAPIGRLEQFKAKFRSLEQLRIYNEFIYQNKAIVNSLWVYNAPAGVNYLYKIRDMAFLLEKKSGKWYIRDSKFKGEHIIHDRAKVERIWREARRSDRRRAQRYLQNQNRRYHRRY
jgi:hypothetical protein